MNLPINLASQAGLEGAVPLFACVIRLEVRQGERLEDCVVARLKDATSQILS